jgi:hypothetical protein
MKLDRARRLLAEIDDVMRHPCDLDLLIFFARHPRTLMGNNQLAILLGYEFKQITVSLDILARAGLLTVSENPAYSARMYEFVAGDQSAAWLPDLLQLASTREGRLALVRPLKERSAGTTVDAPAAARVERAQTAEPGPRLNPGSAREDAAPRPTSNKRRKGRMR